MNIYAVVCFEGVNDEFTRAVKSIDSAAYMAYAPSVYFVQFPGAISSLSDRLGFRDGEAGVTGVVLKVGAGDYHGYARKDLWPYLTQADG